MHDSPSFPTPFNPRICHSEFEWEEIALIDFAIVSASKVRRGDGMKSAMKSMLFLSALIALSISFSTISNSGQCFAVSKSCDTRGGGWSTSEFPHAVVDGCDYVENIFQGITGQVLDLLSIPDLTPPCNDHDRCYYSNDGESAETCNRRFYEAMLQVCAAKYDGLDLLDMGRLRLCNIWVAEIAETVHSVADLEANLPRARKSQNEYMKYIRENCALKSRAPYSCTGPKPTECRQSGDDLCCRNKCEPSCKKGGASWQWQCSKR
jgi:hypothetical protein